MVDRRHWLFQLALSGFEMTGMKDRSEKLKEYLLFGVLMGIAEWKMG
jgi:hypothetical protein